MLHRSSFFGSAIALVFVLAGCERDEGDARFAPDEEVGSVEQAAQVCFDSGVVHGIDVSYYQGSVNWDAVAADGYQFAITRINHGDFMDPEFDANWEGIKQVGMIRGAYQYFDPGGDVAWQAQVVVDKLGMLAPGDLPAVIDVEATDGLSGPAIVNAVSEWIEIVEAGTGKTPILYTGKYFWQDNVGSSAFSDIPLWHAQYPNACQPPNNPPPSCGCANIADQWSDVLVWQYSSSGSVGGISGNVDLNVFNGTYEDLVAFANQGGGYGAELASVEAPKTVLAGETFTVRVTYTNTGASAWDEQTKLGTTEPRDRMSLFVDASWPEETRPAVVTGTVDSGSSYTFELALRAPVINGTYSESFGLVQEGVTWFADQGGPSDDAVTLAIQVINGVEGGSGGGSNQGGGGWNDGGAGEGGDGGGSDDDSDDGCSAAPSGRGGPTFAFVAILMAMLFATRRTRRA